MTTLPAGWHSGTMDPVIPPTVMYGLARDILRNEMNQRSERRRSVGRDTPEGARLTQEIATLVQLGQDLNEETARKIIAAGRLAVGIRGTPSQMQRVDAEDLRSRYPSLLADDAQVSAGGGWSKLLDEAFDRLKGRPVVVRVARENRAGLQLLIGPVGDWRPADFDLAADVTDRTLASSLQVCEVCGAEAAEGSWSRYRTRCAEHKEAR
ncbi:hypothetical protein [Methylobacterium nigriterrae]|uniref:hypothetical protein n=1 Tax=Methylobacterium nigriterrae TaxID=3127512 RepID=UPI003013A584